MSDFSHLNSKENPKMVTISDKKITKRTAIAKSSMFLGKEVNAHFTNEELITKKGPVFQTAIIAGIQGVKKTSDLIPMCHPLLIDGIDIDINVNVINETNGKFSVSIHSNRCIITDEHLDKSDITVGFVNTDTLTEMFLEGGNPISLVMGGRMTFNGDMAKGKELKGLFVE